MWKPRNLSPVNPVPVVGHLDDVVIVSLLVLAALKLTPEMVIADCRIKANRNTLSIQPNGPPSEKVLASRTTAIRKFG